MLELCFNETAPIFMQSDRCDESEEGSGDQHLIEWRRQAAGRSRRRTLIKKGTVVDWTMSFPRERSEVSFATSDDFPNV